MNRDRTWSRAAAAATTMLAALLYLTACGSPGSPGANSPAPQTTAPTSSMQTASSETAPPSPSASSSSSAPTTEGSHRLSNGLVVAVPTGYVVESAGGGAEVQLSHDASLISVAASNGTDPEIIASNVLTEAQNQHMLTDVRRAGSMRYAPTGHATGETMIGYTGTLHVGQTSVPVEGAAVGIARDDGKAVRVLWMEPPGASSQYSGAYRDLLVSLTQ